MSLPSPADRFNFASKGYGLAAGSFESLRIRSITFQAENRSCLERKRQCCSMFHESSLRASVRLARLCWPEEAGASAGAAATRLLSLALVAKRRWNKPNRTFMKFFWFFTFHFGLKISSVRTLVNFCLGENFVFFVFSPWPPAPDIVLADHSQFYGYLSGLSATHFQWLDVKFLVRIKTRKKSCAERASACENSPSGRWKMCNSTRRKTSECREWCGKFGRENREKSITRQIPPAGHRDAIGRVCLPSASDPRTRNSNNYKENYWICAWLQQLIAKTHLWVMKLSCHESLLAVKVALFALT